MKTPQRFRPNGLFYLSIIAGGGVGILLLGAIAFLWFWNPISSSASQNIDPFALLSQIAGIVQVRQADTADFQPVDNGFKLESKMNLQTKEESRVRLDVSTGTIVRLGPNTNFALDSSTTGPEGVASRLQLQAGRIWIILRGGALDVDTPAGLASVRGSYMSVWVEPKVNRITVCCLEGTCGYHNAAGDVDLTSGQKIVSTNLNALPALQKMDENDVQTWLDNNPEAATVIPQVPALATSTPSITPTSTAVPPGATDTPTPTPMPSASASPSATATHFRITFTPAPTRTPRVRSTASDPYSYTPTEPPSQDYPTPAEPTLAPPATEPPVQELPTLSIPLHILPTLLAPIEIVPVPTDVPPANPYPIIQ